MTTYALLIYRTSPPSVPIPELEERQALLDHRALQTEASTRRELHAVARLDDARTAHTVRPRAGGHEIVDGPFMETKEWLVGFYLIDCDSEQQAIARAEQICGESAHAIEVRPVNWRWKQ